MFDFILLAVAFVAGAVVVVSSQKAYQFFKGLKSKVDDKFQK